jgi:hypothetical protein
LCYRDKKVVGVFVRFRAASMLVCMCSVSLVLKIKDNQGNYSGINLYVF